MKRIILMFFCLCFFAISQAQTVKNTKRTLKMMMEFAMPEGDGANGCSVVFHPLTKKYYIPMVGNAIYDMVTFDSKGKQLNVTEAGHDLRGLWYNPKTKNIEGNCYDSGGWVKYTVNAKGEIKYDYDEIFKGMKQPTDQSVGVFNSKDNKVYFLSTVGIVIYNMNGEEEKSMELRETKTGDPIIFDDDNSIYNYTNLIYTGIPNSEIGLLNIKDKKIVLFNKLTGVKSMEWNLPKDAVTQDRFNFAYCNNMVWLFDKENRKWVVYK